MDIMVGLVFFGVGLGLIIFFAEQLVKGVVGTSMGFGLSPFFLSVIFIGFDPDNLAVGTAAYLAFFKCNAGIIALAQPVPVERAVLTFYLPLAFMTTAVVSGFMLTKRVPGWAGGVLILLYAVFAVGGWLM